MPKQRQRAMLALEDGTVFEGWAFGAEGESDGEVVFNTSMTGYQEILTDPSYKGQIVAMTYPLIGNVGVNPDDMESTAPHVAGFVVREYCEYPSNWRATQRLDEFLKEHGVVAMEGVDTRALTRRLRIHGVMRGVISTQDLNPESLVEKARRSPGLVGRDLVKEVTCSRPYRWEQGEFQWEDQGPPPPQPAQLSLDLWGERSSQPRFRVVAVDCGIKHNILRKLVSRGCEVIVVPAHTSAEEILTYQPDGIFFSNGPGDPEGVPYVVETMRQLLGKRPIFGICLGHQMLGLALGGRTFKLKFGHRGGNHPVRYEKSQGVEITAQNHGFAVDAASIPDPDVEITHMNLNDSTLEGIRHRRYPVFSVQYHPEASPGPHDPDYLFDQFIEMMRAWKETHGGGEKAPLRPIAVAR